MSNRVAPGPWQTEFDGSADFDGVNTVLGLIPAGGVYTLTGNIICSTITIRATVRVITAQYTVWARTLTIEAGGFLSHNGANAVGRTAGAAIVGGGHLNLITGAGATGATRATAGTTPGTNAATLATAACGAGGSGGTTGGAGGTSAVTALGADQIRILKTVWTANRNWRLAPVGAGTAFGTYNGGSGGGSGAITLTTNPASSDAGAGGSGGGIVAFRVGRLANYGTISANGGNGSNGVLNAAVTVGGVGGGGGGSGGIVHGIIDVVESLGTITAAGGIGGSGFEIGVSYPNKNGVNGSAGIVAVFLNGEPL